MNSTQLQETETQPRSLSLTARAVWFMVARTIAFALGFGLPLLLVRRLDQYQFGLYKQLFLLAVTAANMLPLGLEMSAFYFLARVQEREQQRRVIANIVLFYSLMTGGAGLAIGLCPSLLVSLFNNPDLANYALPMGILIPLWGAPFLLQTISMANQETRLASSFIVAAEFCKAMLLIGAASMSASVKTLMCAGIIHGCVQVVILVSYLGKRFGNVFWRFDWAVMRTQLSYALPFGLAAVMFRLQTDLHNYYVSQRFGAAAYALYSIGCFNLPLIGILAYSVGAVMIPRVNHLQKQGERREIIALVTRMMRKLAAIYFPIYVVLLITGREFITLFFTKQYLASWPVFVINLTMIPIGIISSANDAVMRAHAEHRYFLIKVRLALIGMLCVGLWFGTAQFGLAGAIGAVVVAALAESSITGFKVTRILGAARGDLVLLGDVGRLAIAAAAAGIAAVLVRQVVINAGPLVVLISCGCAFSLVYIAAILAMKIPTAHEWQAIRAMLASSQRFTPWRRAPAH